MSFQPLKEGHILWGYMHVMACNATTPRKRELYVNWLNSLKESFPCENCRLHLIKNLEEPTADGSVGPGPVEPYSKSNVSLFRHSWKLHDTVNRQLNKPKEQCLTFEQAFEIYFKTKVPVATTTEPEIPQTQAKPQVVQTKKSTQAKVVKAAPVRKTTKTQERFMAAAGNKMPTSFATNPIQEPIIATAVISEPVYVDEPIEMPPSLQCTSCGMPEAEIHPVVEPKQDYDAFRAKARRTFLSKN